VLLNSLDMARKGMEGKIVLEGESVSLVPLMADPAHFLHPLYLQVKEQGLILGACRACSHKLNVADADGTRGHPSDRRVVRSSGHVGFYRERLQSTHLLTAHLQEDSFMKKIELAENVYWVGAVDWITRDFHGYSTERGTTYNAFLIVDEKSP
jgi:hypothetical protein